MNLNNEQEKMLAGEQGEVVGRNFRLLLRLGEIYGAKDMIPITSAQISGVSYKSIGEPGTEFLEDTSAKGGRVRVVTFLNPAGMDLEDWKEIGIPADFAKNQMRIVHAFAKMGVVTSATCTPYLSGNVPRFREHIAWSESSAVSYSNSVLGARTNREGGPSALAAAICGVTPNYGFHLDENRKPDYLVDVSTELNRDSDYGALGYHIGRIVKNKIPYFTGLSNPGSDQLKTLGAAMAASGAVALYHVEGVTPEAHLFNTDGLEKVTVTRKELDESYSKLNTGKNADIIILGCPHASLSEIESVARMVSGRKLKKPLWVCTSRVMKELAKRTGYVATIEKAGGKVVADTCMVVAPIEDMGYGTVAVASGKAANYLPGFCKQKVIFRSVDAIIREMLE